MGACFQQEKNKNNTWGNKNHNEKEKKGENNEDKNDHNYIMQKREEYFQSNEFKKKHIFNNQ